MNNMMPKIRQRNVHAKNMLNLCVFIKYMQKITFWQEILKIITNYYQYMPNQCTNHAKDRAMTYLRHRKDTGKIFKYTLKIPKTS